MDVVLPLVDIVAIAVENAVIWGGGNEETPVKLGWRRPGFGCSSCGWARIICAGVC